MVNVFWISCGSVSGLMVSRMSYKSYVINILLESRGSIVHIVFYNLYLQIIIITFKFRRHIERALAIRSSLCRFL